MPGIQPNFNTVEPDSVLKILNQAIKQINRLDAEVLQLRSRPSYAHLATVSGINAKTVATTDLLTVPAGKTLVVTDVVVRVTAFTSGGKTVQAVANLGGNASDYNDYINGSTFTVSANGQIRRLNNNGNLYVSYAAATVFKLKITTGSNATTETWAVDVFGYYV